MQTLHTSTAVNTSNVGQVSDAERDDWPVALAHVVAHVDPRPFYIGPDNLRTGTAASLAEAITSGLPYALTVADDVMALDLDTDDAVAAADVLAERIKADGWPVMRTTSGRDGHRHLWAIVCLPAARDAIRADIEALGLPRPRLVMRPPLSPHRLDLPVNALDDPVAFITDVRLARGVMQRHDTWRDILRTGHHRGADQSGSATVWRVCIGAARDGLTVDDVRPLLANPDNRGGHGYRRRINDRGTLTADRWLDRHVWPSAAARAVTLPPVDADEARARLHTIAAALDAHRWPGMSGATDRAVMAALVARGVDRGSMTPVMSYREIAEAAPCGLRTVQRSISRLMTAGWLQVARKGCGATAEALDGTRIEVGHATRWRLILPDDARVDHTGGTPPASTSLSVVTTRARTSELSDIGRWGGVGLNAPRILTLLTHGPMTALDLAAALHLNVGNLRARLLPRMAALGLVVRDGARWHLCADLDLAAINAAEALDMRGRTDEVADRHMAERAAYLDHRERTRARRETHRRIKIATDLKDRRPLTPPTAPLPGIDLDVTTGHQSSQRIKQ
jgi:hypothetical protein